MKKSIFQFDEQQVANAAAHSVVEEMMDGKMPKLLEATIEHCLGREPCLREIEKRELRDIHAKVSELALEAAKGHRQHPNQQYNG